MSTTANFFSTPRTAVAQLTTGNTARDGSGTPVAVITGAANGTRIDDIEITHAGAGASSAGVIRLFLSGDGGTTNRLLREIMVTAITPSTSTAGWSHRITDLGLILASASWSLRATTHNTDTFNVCVTRAGDA